jgi:membrane protein DedA with SNARE-associated domain
MDSQVLTAVAAALSGGAQPVLPGFLNSLAGPLGHYGLWAILLLVLVEDFGIPVPGETVLIAGAIFAGSGQLNVIAVGIVGFAAAVIGDNIGYAIGRYGGRALVERWGKYIFLTAERLDKAEAFFDRQGAKIITIARFVEGLRQANGIIAGIAEMHWLRFLAFNALGAALWVGTWVSVGYFAGQHITSIYNGITTYSLYAAIAAVVLIAAWIAYRLRKRRRSGTPVASSGPAEADPAEASPAEASPDEQAEPAQAAEKVQAGNEARAASEANAAGQAETPGQAEAPGEARAASEASPVNDADPADEARDGADSQDSARS